MTTSEMVFKSARELSSLLATGHTSSVDLVTAALDQIERHNHRGKKLNALIAVAPRDKALDRAAALDGERQGGVVRSALHGLPIVLKDTFVTDPALGMPTSSGAAFFATLTAKKNGTIVQRLLDAGLVIVGKGNMTEYCGMKSNDTPVGWSAHGGLTLSAYRREDLDDKDQPTSGGSSNGPAVAVSAGFAPLALGTETSGSAVYPAGVNGIYGIKLSFDTVPLDGVCQLSSSFDHIGCFARDPADLVPLINILTDRDGNDESLTSGFEGLGIGVLQNTWGVQGAAREKWDTAQVRDTYQDAVRRMQRTTRVAHLDAEKPEDVLKHQGETLHSVAYAEFSTNMADFITCFEPVGVKTLQDIVAWNEEHADIALPEPYTTQTELVAAAQSTMTQETRAAAATNLRRIARRVMDNMMGDLDLVLSNSDATLVHYASCAGWPVAVVPLGRVPRNGQPYGMFAMARHGREDLLLRFTRAWDGQFGRCAPPVMVME